MATRLNVLAQSNWFRLAGNPYPGRGIVMGVDETGQNAVQIYFVMGRSENSRNRVLSVEGSMVFTEPIDPTRVKNPDLIIYNAMLEQEWLSVVSNGRQTDKVFGTNLAACLSDCNYEDDPPNYTPRITGVFSRVRKIFELAMLRKSNWGEGCDRFYYHYEGIEPGFGFGITTYSGDGDPLPSFTGEPILLPISGNPDIVVDTYWQNLNEDNRVAIAVKFIPLNKGRSIVKVINKFTKV